VTRFQDIYSIRLYSVCNI